MKVWLIETRDSRRPLKRHYVRGKSKIVVFSLVVISIALLSWGVTGHRTVGKIAEKHLTPKARAAVEDLLGGASLADVSTWADEVRSHPEYHLPRTCLTAKHSPESSTMRDQAQSPTERFS